MAKPLAFIHSLQTIRIPKKDGQWGMPPGGCCRRLTLMREFFRLFQTEMIVGRRHASDQNRPFRFLYDDRTSSILDCRASISTGLII